MLNLVSLDCGKFWECGPNLVPCLFVCPPISGDIGGGSLYFNKELGICDWPFNVDCTMGFVPSSTTPSSFFPTTVTVTPTTAASTTVASTTVASTSTSVASTSVAYTTAAFIPSTTVASTTVASSTASSTTAAITNTNSTTVGSTKAAFTSAASTDGVGNLLCEDYYCTYIGPEMLKRLTKVHSFDSCEDACAEEPECTFFTFTNLRNRPLCYLLSGCSVISPCANVSTCQSGPRVCH